MQISILDYLTPTEIAAVQAYTYTTDVSAAFATAVLAVYASGGGTLSVPAGGYLADIVIPDTTTFGTEYRGFPFELAGDGSGEPFALAVPRGTIIRGTSATTPAVLIKQKNSTGSAGTIAIRDVRVIGSTNSGVPLVDVEALTGTSHMLRCSIYQEGAGDGLIVGLMATGSIEHCYVMNHDFLADTGVTRTGTGIAVRQDVSSGLATIRKCTSRGWNQAYDIGNTSGDLISFSALIEECECSVVNHGIRIRPRTWKAKIRGVYFEGVEGTAVLNEGDYTTIADCDIAFGPTVAIDDSSLNNKGTVIENNSVQTALKPGVTLVKVGSSGTYGGTGKYVGKNSILLSSGAKMTGSISGTKLTASVPYAGNVVVGAKVFGTGVNTNTYISNIHPEQQTFTVSVSQTVAATAITAGAASFANASIAGTTLTADRPYSGTVVVGDSVGGTGVASGTTITAIGSPYQKFTVTGATDEVASTTMDVGRANVIGVQVTGDNPRIHGLETNSFTPRGPWLGGPGTAKVSDSATGNGVYALTLAQSGEYEFPYLSQGAVSLFAADLGMGNISGSTLSVPDGSLFYLYGSSGSPATITSINGGRSSGRLIVLYVTDSHVTFQNTAQLCLGTNFTGPGILTLFTRRIGSTHYAYQIARSPL